MLECFSFHLFFFFPLLINQYQITEKDLIYGFNPDIWWILNGDFTDWVGRNWNQFPGILFIIISAPKGVYLHTKQRKRGSTHQKCWVYCFWLCRHQHTTPLWGGIPWSIQSWLYRGKRLIKPLGLYMMVPRAYWGALSGVSVRRSVWWCWKSQGLSSVQGWQPDRRCQPEELILQQPFFLCVSKGKSTVGLR